MELVWTKEYQTQVLHHASTYMIQHVLFVVGSDTSIIHCTLVTFPINVLQDYREIITEFGDKYIAWHHDTTNLKNELEDVNLHNVVDYPTIMFWRKMALKMELNLDE